MTLFDYIILLMAIFLSRAVPPLFSLVLAACLGMAAFITGVKA